MDKIKLRSTTTHGFEIITTEPNESKLLFWGEFQEFTGCCGVHVVHSLFHFSNKHLSIYQTMKLVTEWIDPKVRLCYLTHNDTPQGRAIIRAALKCGWNEDHVVVSNHKNEGNGNIHVLSYIGSKPAPLPPKDYDDDGDGDVMHFDETF